MPRIGAVLLCAVAALSSGQSLAFPAASDHCSSDQIWAAIRATGTFPKLRGCSPQAVQNALSDSNYRLVIDNRHSSESIAPGLITQQHVQATTVYVTVSTGPDEPGAGQHPPGIGGLIGNAIVSMIEHPPQTHQQTTPPPVVQVTPLPPQPPPVPPPPVIKPAPPAPGPVQVAAAASVAAPTPPPAAKPAPTHKPTPKTKTPQAAKPVPTKPEPVVPGTIATTTATPVHSVVQASDKASSQEKRIPPTFPRFWIVGSKRITEGDDLELEIHRERSDHAAHRLVLSYSPASLLSSAQTSFDYGADLPDVITQKLATKVNSKHDGDNDLTVTLVSAEGASVGNPDSLMVAIADLNEPSWWDKLKLFLASLPAWAIALAGGVIAATAGLGINRFVLPHAVCSIGSGRATLGPIPLKSCWPALHIDTTVGVPSFSIPHPLPMGVETHAEPSPA